MTDTERNELWTKVQDNAKMYIADYRRDTLKESKDWIFDHSFEINAIQAISSYIIEVPVSEFVEFLTDYQLKELTTINLTLELYTYYLDNEFAHIDVYDELYELFKRFIEYSIGDEK